MEKVPKGEEVPTPVEPETMRPFVGAALTVAYVPIETLPFTSSVLLANGPVLADAALLIET